MKMGFQTPQSQLKRTANVYFDFDPLQLPLPADEDIQNYY